MKKKEISERDIEDICNNIINVLIARKVVKQKDNGDTYVPENIDDIVHKTTLEMCNGISFMNEDMLNEIKKD